MRAKLFSVVGGLAHQLGHWLHVFPGNRRRMHMVRCFQNATTFTQVSGLTKSQAEELLDCLEAEGVVGCQTDYEPGKGFTVFRK